MSQNPGQIRVFVVDDEQVIASSLAVILRTRGFDASPFASPQEALHTAFSDPPDLLISDVVMPILSGIELAIQIKQQCPSCKVLLFSGQAATVDMLEAARADGHSFELLAKPVHPTDLLRKIQKTMNVATQGTSE